MDELEFQRQFVPDGPPSVNDILARRLAPDPQEARQLAEERAADSERAERAENMRLANYQHGDPLGNLSRCQMAVGAARDRVRDLEGQLESAREVLHRAASEYVDWTEAAEMVTASARRSGDPDMLAEAKRAAAEYRVEQMLSRAAAQPVKARRPFARRGTDGTGEITCEECRKQGASPAESFAIHHPELLPPMEEQTEPAERHAYSGSREISR